MSESGQRRSDAAPAPPAPREFRQERARASFERVLDAALSLYSERGFHATQTSDIAERAGISVGGLYRYFSDKNEIFAELMHRILETNRRLQDQMIRAAEADLASGQIDLRGLVERSVGWTWEALESATPDLLRTFRAMTYEDPAFAELCDQYDRYERRALARFLAKLTSRQHIPSPLAAARLIDEVVPAMALWAALHPNEARGVREATVEMIFRYLSGTGS